MVLASKHGQGGAKESAVVDLLVIRGGLEHLVEEQGARRDCGGGREVGVERDDGDAALLVESGLAPVKRVDAVGATKRLGHPLSSHLRIFTPRNDSGVTMGTPSLRPENC